jgi:hypothetical protein
MQGGKGGEKADPQFISRSRVYLENVIGGFLLDRR